jgi:hypothetical protein
MNVKSVSFISISLFLYSSVILAEQPTAVTQSIEEVKQEQESKSVIEQVAASEKGADKAAKTWIPTAVKFDWIQLTSNEWLKGEIKGMYKDSLEFDSDKLDLLDIDWKDVKILRSYRVNNINIESIGATSGVLEVTDNSVKIINDYEDAMYDRSQLISFAPGGKNELDLWSVKATLSLDLRQGNTVETVNNHRFNASFDYYKTRYFFYTPVFLELFRDPFTNIDMKITVGAGLGYTIIDDGKTELIIGGGPAYVKTDFISVGAGENESESTLAAVLKTDYDTELTNTLDFIAKYNIQVGNHASGGYTHHIILTLESEITGSLDIDTSFIWDRTSNPTEASDGTKPFPDDFRITLGISYTY